MSPKLRYIIRFQKILCSVSVHRTSLWLQALTILEIHWLYHCSHEDEYNNVIIKKELKVIILTGFQSFVSNLVQPLSNPVCYVILSALPNYKKKSRRRLGDHVGFPQGVQWQACPCAREAGSPQQLLSSKMAVLSLHNKVNKGIGFTD